jgi:glutathione S-transferase
MLLIGRYLSPFVRRVAATLNWLEVPYEHRSLSPANDADAVRPYNPMVKVPALVLDNGDILVESGAILDSILETIPGQTLLPMSGVERRRVLQNCAIMTSALDKSVAAVYEKTKRPKEKIHQPFLDLLTSQVKAGVDQVNNRIASGEFGAIQQPSIADITAAVGFTFIHYALPDCANAQAQPALAALAAQFEETEAFKACQFEV